MNLLSLIPFLLIALSNIISNSLKSRLMANMTKPLIIPLLLMFYVSNMKVYHSLLIMGLLFGWLGDIIMIFHHKHKTQNMPLLHFGLGAFFIGHMFYIMLFKQLTTSSPLLIPLYVFVAVVTLNRLFKLGIFKRKAHLILKSLIVLYTVVLVLMSAFSYSLTVSFIGTLCFLFSDTLLAYREFGQIKVPEGWVMATYIAAQFLITLGIMLH